RLGLQVRDRRGVLLRPRARAVRLDPRLASRRGALRVSDVAAVPARAFVLPLTVVPEDVDEQGHASNVRILGYMNQAAIAHSDALGYDVARYREVGGIFVVRRHEIDYLASAYEGERL